MARMEADESDTKRATVRVPAELPEQYEEALDDDDTNRSEDLVKGSLLNTQLVSVTE